VNIKIIVCQIIGPAAAGSAGPVPTPVSMCNNNLAGSGYIFQMKCRPTEAVLSNSTRKLLWFEITKMLIAV